MKHETYLERMRAAQAILSDTPFRLPRLARCDLWWRFDQEDTYRFLYFYQSREDAVHAMDHTGYPIDAPARATSDCVRYRCGMVFDDGVTAATSRVEGDNEEVVEQVDVFVPFSRWVPCDSRSIPVGVWYGRKEGIEQMGLENAAAFLGCDSADELSRRLSARATLAELMELGGNTLAWALKRIDPISEIRDACEALGNKSDPEGILRGDWSDISIPSLRKDKQGWLTHETFLEHCEMIT